MTDYKALGAHLDEAAQAWDTAATSIEAELTSISVEKDYLDYVDCLTAGDPVRLGQVAAAKVTAAETQLDVLSTIAGPTADVTRAARHAAGQLADMRQGFDLVDTFPASFRPGLQDFLTANGATTEVASWAAHHLFTSQFPDNLQRLLYARAFGAAENYDTLALEAMRSAAGGRLGQLVSATKTSAATTTPQTVRDHLNSLQDQLLTSLEDPGRLVDIKAATTGLLEEAGDIQVPSTDLASQVLVGELLRELLRTAAAVDLVRWTSAWTEPMVPAHVLADARSGPAVEIDCPPPPGPDLVLTPSQLLAAPPADDTIVSVAGQLTALTFTEHAQHVSSWSSLTDVTDPEKSVFVLDLYAMLDTSGEATGSTAVIQGKFNTTDPTTGGPTIAISHDSLTPDPLARRWKRALDSIYVTRVHGEHAWWSWDVGEALGAANPLLFGKWWR